MPDERTHRGHNGDYLLREVELGQRAAVRLGNEQEGWGAWVDGFMFKMDVNALDLLHENWIPAPHPGQDTSLGQRKAAVLIPRQRESAELIDGDA